MHRHRYIKVPVECVEDDIFNAGFVRLSEVGATELMFVLEQEHGFDFSHMPDNLYDQMKFDAAMVLYRNLSLAELEYLTNKHQ